MRYFDVLIIGSGAAGLGVALSLPETISIAIVTKDMLETGASPRAQGGIAAVMDNQDNLEAHVQDTLIAGAGLCDEKAVRFTVYHAKEAINWLIAQGVVFNTQPNSSAFHLTQEGGHSHRRILHAADKTGNEVITNLAAQILKRKNITCFTAHTAIDLILQDKNCVGATLLNNKTQEIINLFSKITLLATGGASSVYLHASNPDMNSGDGIAMAYRAGAAVSHLEFHQFHPTCLYHEQADSFLISEAVRGEGGILRLKNGEAFMSKYDSRKELAPRDIVTRAIDTEMKKNHLDCVYLDVTHLDASKIKSHFPTIDAKCLSLGIDMTKEYIPVVPAAHYTCGGVVTNLQGETNIAHLFAVGEVAYTGLHGANRMASNSLLECLVFAKSAAQRIQETLPNLSLNIQHPDVFCHISNQHIDTKKYLLLDHQIKKIMWSKVGIIRNNQDLKSAQTEIMNIQNKVEKLYQENKLSRELIETKNLALIANLIIQAAINRKKSVGLHYNTDCL